jgi:hypothetical protein
MSRKLIAGLFRSIIPIVLLACLLALATAPALGLSVSNAAIVGSVDPGETYTHTMTVTIDSGDAATDISVDVAGVQQLPSGGYQLLDASHDTSQYSARRFVTVDKAAFHMEPGGSEDITATIVVPQDVGDGGRYAMIHIVTTPAGTGGVGSAVDVPVYLTVNNSQLIHTGHITGVASGEITSGQPINILTDFQSTGNHHFKVKGEVTVTNDRGQNLDIITTPLTSSSILPGMVRQLEASFIPSGDLPAGTYTVDSKVMLEDGTLLDQSSTTFEVTASITYDPNQPINVLPYNGSMGASRTCMLQSSAFSYPDSGDTHAASQWRVTSTHAASQWQVTSTAGDYSAPIFDSGVDAGHLTSIAVPSGVLQYSTTCYWHVRHQASHGAWSPWSAETSFTTAAQPKAGFAVSSVGSAEGFILVFFTNLSSGGASPLTYAWDFENDGTIDATEREPWHPYSTSGTYTVSLTVTDAWGDTDSEVKVNCLTVLSSSAATVETADGQVSTEFPSGAVTGSSMVTIGTRTVSGIPEVPGEFMIGDTCFVITALDDSGNEIVTLSQPSIITVKYSEADLATAGGDSKNLVLAYWDEAAGRWKVLKTTVDTASMTLSASTTHLSTWVVLVKNPSEGLALWTWIVIGVAAALGAGILAYFMQRRLAAR